jgi:predicted RNase H-like HicB family nuclease
MAPMRKITLTIVYEDGEDDRILASIPAVPGALSQGRDRAEARANFLDALALMLSPEPTAPDDGCGREVVRLTVS